MNATPLISVVIPTYNHAHFLGRALQSVIDQTYTNWEVIVIDNYSTDSTDAVMAHFAAPNITYLKINNNGVIAASRNAGIRKAKGQWIALLDSDDWWATDKLSISTQYIADEVDLIYHDLEIVAHNRRQLMKKLIKSWQVQKPVLIDLMINGNAIATSSVLFRKKLFDKIGGMNESVDMVAAEDYNMWLRIASITDGFRYVPRRLGYYQLHTQGISQKDMSEPSRLATVDFVGLLKLHQLDQYEANLSYTRGRYNYLEGNYAAARKDLLFAAKYGLFRYRFKCIWMIVSVSIIQATGALKNPDIA